MLSRLATRFSRTSGISRGLRTYAKDFEKELGSKPKFLRRSPAGIVLFAILGAIPLFGYPYYASIKEQERVTKGHDLLKEFEAEKSGSIKVHSVAPEQKDSHYKYVLVGTGTASYSAMEAIKEKDPDAEILVIGEEMHNFYMRPPLSKELWQSKDPNVATTLKFKDYRGKEVSVEYKPDEWYQKNGVKFLKGVKVVDLNANEKKLTLEDGSVVSFDKCLLATGGTPRQIPGAQALPDNISTFRTVEDFKRLDGISRRGGKIVVVGGSFLGTELSYALAQREGVEVVQVYPEPVVLARNLPRYLSASLSETLKDAGVNLKPNRVVTKVEKGEQDKVVLSLDNQESIVADHIVVAVGVSPNIELAEKAGLEIDRIHGGIVVNSELEARSDIFAAGDVMSYHDRSLGRRRIEHYEHAASTGRHAGLNMAGRPRAFEHLSMFWSDVGKVSFEAVGDIDSNLDTVSFWGSVAVTQNGAPWYFADNPMQTAGFGGAKGVVYYMRDKRVVGVLLWNNHNKIDAARKIIAERKVIESEAELSSKIPL